MATCAPAETTSLHAFYVGGFHIIAATGYRASQSLQPRIVELPIDIYPPQFRVELCGEPGPRKMTPYTVTEAFRFGPAEDELVVYTASGKQVVPVEPLPPVLSVGPDKAGLASDEAEGGGTVVEGYSPNLSVDEAIADATAKLLATGSSAADDLLTTEVLSIGTAHGGFAGVHVLAVKMVGRWASATT